MPEALGIMGGTFDPIHFGHLAAAEEARTRFSLPRVIFVPNGQAPHKKAYSVTPAQHRYNMVALATAANPHFAVSRVEIDRPGPSYAVDTLRLLRREFPHRRLYFITGADAILEILTWREPERIAQDCEFIAVTRPGYDLRRLQEAVTPDLLARVHTLDVLGVAISSTELRRRAAEGQSLRYLTPSSVVHYIATHCLYAAVPAPCKGSPGGSAGGMHRPSASQHSRKAQTG